MDAEPAVARPAVSSSAATAAGVGAIILWCANGVCAAAGTRAVGMLAYLALTSLVGVATIVVLRLGRGSSVRQLFTPPPRVVGAGFFGVAAYTLLLTAALGWADEKDLGQIMLLNYLWPVWIVLLSILLLPMRVRLSWALAGVMLGFAGIALARDPRTLATLPRNTLPHLMALAASFLWAWYSVMLRRWSVPIEQTGSTLQFLVCAVLATILNSVYGSWRQLAHLDLAAVGLIAFGGIGPVGLAYYWWEIGVKRGRVYLMALLSYFIPIVSVVLIAGVYREALSGLLIPGAALIASGAFVGHRASAEAKSGA